MLRISKLADYAAAIMAYAARASANTLTCKKIAHELALPETTVSKILKLLTKAQLLTSKKGVQGGYNLSKAPEQISIVEIISAIDGNIALTDCANHRTNCQLEHHCHTKYSWQIINQVIFETLSTIHLIDLAKQTLQPKKILS